MNDFALPDWNHGEALTEIKRLRAENERLHADHDVLAEHAESLARDVVYLRSRLGDAMALVDAETEACADELDDLLDMEWAKVWPSSEAVKVCAAAIRQRAASRAKESA